MREISRIHRSSRCLTVFEATWRIDDKLLPSLRRLLNTSAKLRRVGVSGKNSFLFICTALPGLNYDSHHHLARRTRGRFLHEHHRMDSLSRNPL